MSMARPSPVRPLLVGAVIGFVLGLILGLLYAWLINPAVYSGGALPNELTQADQKYYVKAAVDEYLKTNDLALLRSRLRSFSDEEKVRNLAASAGTYQGLGQAAEAQLVANLAATLKAQEGWDDAAVAAGLTQALRTDQVEQTIVSEFNRQLLPAATQQPAAAQPGATAGAGLARSLLACLLLTLALLAAVVVFVWFRRRRGTQAREAAEPAAFAFDYDRAGPQPLKQWMGTYTIGQDNYDESFTVETAEGDFLGECGMGILEFVPGSSPKQVWAFDVWLFDKTDIRTISKVLMSEQAYDDASMREKVSSKGDLLLAEVGTEFAIDTTALHVKARVEEVTYTPEGYFSNAKVVLGAFLKPGVDVGADMPIPEGLA